MGRALVAFAWCTCAFALNPELDVSQYAHSAWKIREGFVAGVINSIAQTPDGYLWLATDFGLFRFDGVKNLAWRPSGNQHLPSDDVRSLLAARDGTLWIGSAKGLAGWKDGKLTEYAQLKGQTVNALFQDREGTVWAGGVSVPPPVKLCAIQKDGVHCDGEDGSLGPLVFGFHEDRNGSLWAGVVDGMWRWKPGTHNFYGMPGNPDGIRGFAEGDDRALLIVTRAGISQLLDGKLEPYAIPGIKQHFRPMNMLRDRDGGLWIGTFGQGLMHIHQGKTDVFTQADGLSGNDVVALFEDRENNIWVATLNGLDRFRAFAVNTLTVKQGLSSGFAASVLADGDAKVWVSTFAGLNQWENGRIAIFRTPGGKREGSLNGENPNSLFRDGRGRIWVSTPHGFGYLEDGRFVPVRGVPGESIAIAEDTARDLWIANQTLGLFRLSPRGEVQQIPWTDLGHKDNALALAADPSQGGVWLGFLHGGITHFVNGGIRASYSAADGLGEGAVNDLRVDPDGTLWATTQGGLSYLKHGRIATLTSRNGLPCDAVEWIIEDDDHSLWLNMRCGLVRIERPDLDAWLETVGKDKTAKPAIQAAVFDGSEGVRKLSYIGAFSPHAAKSSDGKLWFSTVDGVSMVDPRHLPINRLPPPVHIEQITADRRTYDA